MNDVIYTVLNLIIFSLLPFLALLFFVYLLYLFLQKYTSEKISKRIENAFPTVFISFGTSFSLFAFWLLGYILFHTHDSRPRVALLMGFLAVTGGVFLILQLVATVQSYENHGGEKTFLYVAIGAAIGIILALLAAQIIAVL